MVNRRAKALSQLVQAGKHMVIRVAAVVVAAGRGTRSGLDFPKQYKVMGGEPMVRATLRAFATHPAVDRVVPVIHPEDSARFAAASDGLRLGPAVHGAATRQGSVRAGLAALER